jgi:hypothetical protein
LPYPPKGAAEVEGMMIAQIIQKLVGPLAMVSGKDTSSLPMAEGGDAFTALMGDTAQVPPEIPAEAAQSGDGLIAAPTDSGAMIPMAVLVQGDVAINFTPLLENQTITGADNAPLAKAIHIETAAVLSGDEGATALAGGNPAIARLPLADIALSKELGLSDTHDPVVNNQGSDAPLAENGQKAQVALSGMSQSAVDLPDWKGQNGGQADDSGHAPNKAGASQIAQKNMAALAANSPALTPTDDDAVLQEAAKPKNKDLGAPNRAATQTTPNDLARITTMPVNLAHITTGPMPAPSLWQKAQNMGIAPVSSSGAQGLTGGELDVDSSPNQDDIRAQTSALNTAQIASQMQRHIAHWQAFERYLFEQRSDLAIGDMPLVQTHLGDSPSPAQIGGVPALPSHMPQPSPASPIAAQLLPYASAAQSGPVEVTLNPQELGQLRFEIQHRGEGVQIILSAERMDTMDLLRRNGEQLLADFRYAGFSGASLSFGKWGGAGQGQGQSASAPLDDIPLADTAISAPPNLFAAARPPADASRNLNLRL